MIREQIGDGNDLAEIIIDYPKKKISILDGETGDKITHHELNFSNIHTPIVILITYIISLIVIMMLKESWVSHLDFLMVNYILSIGISFYFITILYTPFKKKFHKVWQFLTNDFFKLKKFMIIENIKDKKWISPDWMKFSNILCNYKLYKDYGKFIKKVWIRPRDYYVFRRKDKKRQIEEWEVIFEFSKIPKNGRIELTWI